MKVDYLGLLYSWFSRHGDPADARVLARRWQNAIAAEPDLVGDVVGLSGLLQPLDAATPSSNTLDPQILAYRQGQRDLGLQFLTLMGVSQAELTDLILFPTEKNDDEHYPF